MVLTLATDICEQQPKLSWEWSGQRLIRSGCSGCLKLTCMLLCDREERGRSEYQLVYTCPYFSHCLPPSLGCERQRNFHLHLVS